MPISPQDAKIHAESYIDSSVRDLSSKLFTKIDNILTERFSSSYEKYQVIFGELLNYRKEIQDSVLVKFKTTYEDLGWKTWCVQDKESKSFVFTLELPEQKHSTILPD